MAKFNAKNLGIAFLLGMFLIGVVGIVNAQQTLPKGGDSIETVVKLEPGSYQRDAMEEKEYFFVDVKAGQEINIKYTFGVGTGRDGWGILFLYDEDRAKLVEDYDVVSDDELKSITISWLLNADKDSYKYYIKTGYDRYDVGSVSFDMSLTDYYDAGSQTDAGDSFEKAMSITPGEYKAYLSGASGADTKDFYKLAVKTGQTLTVKITPPTEANIEVVVYDSNKKILTRGGTPNPGAIFTTSVPITKSEDVFVAVVCDRWMSKNLVEYTMDISTEGIPADGVEDGVPSDGVPSDGVPRGEPAKGLNWALILGIIAIIVVIGIVVYFLLKKKK